MVNTEHVEGGASWSAIGGNSLPERAAFVSIGQGQEPSNGSSSARLLYTGPFRWAPVTVPTGKAMRIEGLVPTASLS